jgi:hypothetical protein
MSSPSPNSPDPKWFPAKRYGWGWGPPRCWQGWAVLGSYVALLAVGVAVTLPSHHVVFFVAYEIFLTALLITIAWWKGDPPRWRWGGE